MGRAVWRSVDWPFFAQSYIVQHQRVKIHGWPAEYFRKCAIRINKHCPGILGASSSKTSNSGYAFFGIPTTSWPAVTRQFTVAILNKSAVTQGVSIALALRVFAEGNVRIMGSDTVIKVKPQTLPVVLSRSLLVGSFVLIDCMGNENQFPH